MLRQLVSAGVTLIIALVPAVTGNLEDIADSLHADFRQSALAPRLCPQGAQPGLELVTALACQVGRSQYTVAHGAKMRAKAITQGAECERMAVPQEALPVGPKTLWVCFGYESFLIQRGGTTYGDTFFSTQSKQNFGARVDLAQVLEHEARHVLQWHVFGAHFPQLYLEAGPNACANIFEVQAGLALGGYRCE